VEKKTRAALVRALVSYELQKLTRSQAKASCAKAGVSRASFE
jgi:hypothetical protein